MQKRLRQNLTKTATLSTIAALCFQANSQFSCQAAPKQPKPELPKTKPASGWNPTEFPIGYWLGPPEPYVTLERYQEIKNAGLNLITANGGAQNAVNNRKMLDLTRKLGLKAIIGDSRMPFKITGNPGAKEAIDAVLKDYKDDPALAGYEVYDEPNTSMFEGLGEVVAYVKEKDPAHPVFINILPNYATPEQLGAPTYEAYVRKFMEVVRPAVLSYDHYHFGQTFERPEFFTNLSIVSRVAREYKVPFWQIVLVTQHADLRNVSEAEIRYEAMQTLAYGGKGLRWFTYWTPNDVAFNWAHAMINLDGTRDAHYGMVQRVNSDLLAFGNQLLHADSLTVFHTGDFPAEAQVTRREGGTPIDVIGPAKLTVGLFRRNKTESLALVANADHARSTKAEIAIFSGAQAPQIFNRKTAKWEAAPSRVQPGGYRVALELTAGDAALLKW